MSLSRGPALMVGTVLLVAGLYFLYRGHTFPRLSQFPNGHAPVSHHAFFGIFGINGWTGELTAVAGGLLLFGAAEHLLAKTMSLIVGVALGVVAVWALVDHNSAMGLFATNIWTIVGWGGAAVLLLINTLVPRRRVVETVPATAAAPAAAAPVAAAPAAAAPVAAAPAGRRAMDDQEFDEPAMNQRGMNDPAMTERGMNDPAMNDPAMNDGTMTQPGAGQPVADETTARSAGGPLSGRRRGISPLGGATQTGGRPTRRQPSTGTALEDPAAEEGAATSTRGGWAGRLTGRNQGNVEETD